MTRDEIQRRRREICAELDRVRRQLGEIRSFRVRLGQAESSQTEKRLFHRVFRLTDELVTLDMLADGSNAG
jgi:hypothetical protein